MQFKYASYHKECKPCPPAKCSQPQRVTGYRLVTGYDPIPAIEYQPPAIQTPSRTFKNSDLKCCAYALSFFQAPDQARDQYKRLSKQIKKIAQLTHIAETIISPADGKITPSNHNGHFDLHEFVDADLLKTTTVVGRV